MTIEEAINKAEEWEKEFHKWYSTADISADKYDLIAFISKVRQEAYKKGKKAGVIEQMQASADAFPALKEKIVQEAIAGERERIRKELEEEAVVITLVDAEDLVDNHQDSPPLVYLDDALSILTPSPDTSTK